MSGSSRYGGVMARRPRHALFVVFAGALALAIAGCQPPLFSQRDPRSPYDQYDVVRDSYELPYIEDEFGRKKPNLRGRLVRP